MLQMESVGAALASRLVALQLQIDLLKLERARLAAEFDRSAYWDEAGSNSSIDWIRFNCHLASGEVANALTVGERLASLGASVAALEAGEIGYAHLSAMARTAEAVGERFEESQLLELARQCSPGKFYYKCQHYRHAVDARGYAAEQEQLVEERRLSLSTAEDGCLLISGVLDPVGGAALRAALEPLAQRSGEHDERVMEQRWADALVELVSGGRPAQVQVTSTLETLLGLAGAPGAEMEFSLPVSSATVQRMACEGGLSRVLLGAESLVIDVGRSKRVVSGGRRRALKVRDGHCRWPGCERPASWCDGHHLVHWIHGGSSDLDNLVLLCQRHHRLVHEGGWQVVKTEDGRLITIAPTVNFGAAARGPD